MCSLELLRHQAWGAPQTHLLTTAAPLVARLYLWDNFWPFIFFRPVSSTLPLPWARSSITSVLAGQYIYNPTHTHLEALSITKGKEANLKLLTLPKRGLGSPTFSRTARVSSYFHFPTNLQIT